MDGSSYDVAIMPSITAISQDSGSLAGGTALSIYGQSFCKSNAQPDLCLYYLVQIRLMEMMSRLFAILCSRHLKSFQS